MSADNETVVGPGERISVERALRAITVDAAFVLRKDDVLGSIEPGKYADFAILDDDPCEVKPLNLKDIPIRGTILGGEVNLAAEN